MFLGILSQSHVSYLRLDDHNENEDIIDEQGKDNHAQLVDMGKLFTGESLNYGCKFIIWYCKNNYNLCQSHTMFSASLTADQNLINESTHLHIMKLL